jgi:hypothetical protein
VFDPEDGGDMSELPFDTTQKIVFFIVTAIRISKPTA